MNEMRRIAGEMGGTTCAEELRRETAPCPTSAVSNAFTLIELLVVIAIIAVLTAILFPVFASARKSALTTSCLSNLRQIGLATQMYTDDWDDTFPYNAGPRFTPSKISDTLARDDPRDQSNRFDGAPLVPVLQPYVRNTQIWYCPALPVDMPENGPHTNYQINAFLAVNSIPDTGRPHAGPVRAGEILNPPRIKIWQDHWNRGLGVHRNGGNYGCVDGHAKWQISVIGGGGSIVARWWTP